MENKLALVDKTKVMKTFTKSQLQYTDGRVAETTVELQRERVLDIVYWYQGEQRKIRVTNLGTKFGQKTKEETIIEKSAENRLLHFSGFMFEGGAWFEKEIYIRGTDIKLVEVKYVKPDFYKDLDKKTEVA